MATTQRAVVLGIGHHAARVLMINMEAAGTPPITMQEGRWVMLPYHLQAVHMPGSTHRIGAF